MKKEVIKMTLTYCGIILNIMVALLRIERNTNEYADLLILQRIASECGQHRVIKGVQGADIDSLLKVFRDKTHLRVSTEDLYVYFSNMGVFKV